MKFSKMWNILFRSKDPDHYWKQCLFFMTLIVLLFYLIKYQWISIPYFSTTLEKLQNRSEGGGFEQSETYVLQVQDKSYDPFYVEVYDLLHPISAKEIKAIADSIENETQPSTAKSVFLDIGCGTGKMIREISKRGYRVTGIDLSHTMISVASQNLPLTLPKSEIPLANPEIEFLNPKYELKCQNVLTPKLYEPDDFSHILVLGPTTLYEICAPGIEQTSPLLEKPTHLQVRENLQRLIQNAHQWLRRGGYFIVQIEPLDHLSQKWIQPIGGQTFYYPYKKKVTHPDPHQTHISFSDVDYRSQYLPPLPSFPSLNPQTKETTGSELETSSCAACGVIQETFVDLKSQKVRQNEWRLYAPFDDPQDIIRFIEKTGFMLTKETGLRGHPIYLFQKM